MKTQIQFFKDGSKTIPEEQIEFSWTTNSWPIICFKISSKEKTLKEELREKYVTFIKEMYGLAVKNTKKTA